MKSELFFSYTYNLDLFYFTTQISKVNTSIAVSLYSILYIFSSAKAEGGPCLPRITATKNVSIAMLPN